MRISPSEVHIQDPDFYENVYRLPYEKLHRLKHRFNNSLATFSTVDYNLHKTRRAALNPFFSQRKITEYSPVIQEHIQRLCSRIENEYAGNSRPLVLNDVWGCLTSDTVVGYCFERSYHFIDEQNFKASFPIAMEDLVNGVHYVTQFPWLSTTFQTLPGWILAALQPSMKSVIDFNNVGSLFPNEGVFAHRVQRMTSQIIDVLSNRGDSQEKSPQDTIFNALLESDLPPEELSLPRLQHEAISVVGAGLETTKWALTVGCFHILDNPPVLSRLRAELMSAIPDPMSVPALPEIQNLTYLSAVIEESTPPLLPTPFSKPLFTLYSHRNC